MHGVDAELSDLGVAVLSPAAIGCDEKRNGEFAEGSWGRERRLTRLARFVVENPSLELVCFQSFGCGYDAASIPYARQELEKEGKGLVVLKIDSITDTAHARIRLRTLFETIDVGGGFDWGRVAGADYALLQRLGCSGTRGEIPGGKIERRDIDVALATMPSDFCIVAKALAGRAVRRVLAERSLESIGVPAVCKRCMLDAVPDAIERVCDCGVRVYLTDEMLVDGRCDVFESAGPPTRPRVGILGNALLVFDSFMNDGLVALIESEECEVVLPRLEGLLVDDVRYVSELDRFSALGVVHVIYLQAFGCLKGHVQARGSLRLLERRYPDMQFTVIDYDVEASALNRENRVLLALAAAKRAFYSY